MKGRPLAVEVSFELTVPACYGDNAGYRAALRDVIRSRANKAFEDMGVSVITVRLGHITEQELLRREHLSASATQGLLDLV